MTEFARVPNGLLRSRPGGATLLGVIVNPLAALLPLIETGPGAEHNCTALTRRATRPPGAGPPHRPGQSGIERR